MILDEQKRTHPLDDLEEVCSGDELRALQAARPRDLRGPGGQRLHRPARRLDPRPPRRVPRRQPARVDRAVPRLAGPRRPAGPRLRDPRRREGARRARAGPPRHHQDAARRSTTSRRRTSSRELLESTPIEAARQAGGPREVQPEPRRLDRPATARTDGRTAPMLRRLQLLVLAVVLVVAAFSTGYAVPVLPRLPRAARRRRQLHPHAPGPRRPRGRLRREPAQRRTSATGCGSPTPLRNTGRLPKPWLEVHNPTTLPGGLPGRALSLGGRGERSWLVRTLLEPRGHFRIEPLQIRTGDPFGFFEASAGRRAGHHARGLPARSTPLPLWRLPPASIEGAHASPERTLQTTPLATTVRPYAPGDSMNRIHWRTTARLGEIQVKEFDLEQTADAWIFLDLDAEPWRPASATTPRPRSPSARRRRSPTRRSARTAPSGSR